MIFRETKAEILASVKRRFSVKYLRNYQTWVITGSGNSPNVIRAVEYARQCNAITIGLLGFSRGKVKDMLDHEITVKSDNYGVIESVHPAIHHLMVGYFRQMIDGEKLITR